jgi:hypothetical protein
MQGGRTAALKPAVTARPAPVVVTRVEATAAPAPAPVKPRVRLEPVASPQASPEAPPRPKAANPLGASVFKFKWRKPVMLNTSLLLLIVAGALVLVVLVWVGAYTLGSKDGEAKTLADKGLSAPGVVDPLKAEHVPLNNRLVSPEPTQRQSSGTGTRGTAKVTTPHPPAPALPAPVAPGEIAAGLNYCIAASRLDKDQAERAAGFLRENGVPATPVQVVEGEWSGANNAGSWMVVVTRGITGKEYGSQAPARAEVEKQLARLGQMYAKDPKGRIDFGQFAWSKRK